MKRGKGMRRRFCGLVLFGLTVLFAAFSAQAVHAAPSGGIAPYIRCPDGAEMIPAGSELVIISAWGTGSYGNALQFLGHQVIVWDVLSPTGTIVATSGSRISETALDGRIRFVKRRRSKARSSGCGSPSIALRRGLSSLRARV